MTYYYNKDGKFQPESSVEYKTQKGAADRMNKEGEGAVYDETGRLLISLADEKDVPEGALAADADGNVPIYNKKNEQVGTVDAGTAALAARESSDKPEQPEEDPNTGILFSVHTTCDMLRIRSGAGYIYHIVGYIEEKPGRKKDHDIAEEKDGFGRLADGSGWIDLKQTVRVN